MSMEVRIDKWLWAARIFKTRTMASDACKNGRIMIDGIKQKPSRLVKEGDIIQVRKPPVTYSFKILKAIQNRVGAKLIPYIMEDVTPPTQLEILEMNRVGGFLIRAKGSGRPTKKERREIDELATPEFFADFDDVFFDKDDESALFSDFFDVEGD
jgi:ribosome-associated heat shock protein Hsp15